MNMASFVFFHVLVRSSIFEGGINVLALLIKGIF